MWKEVKQSKHYAADHPPYRQEVSCCVNLTPKEFCLKLKVVFTQKTINVLALIKKVKHKAENTTQLESKWLQVCTFGNPQKFDFVLTAAS